MVFPFRRYHFTVIGNDFHADVGCFSNITDNDVNLTLPLGSLAQLVDVLGFHADSFNNDAVFVAVVLYPLQFVRIPAVPFRQNFSGDQKLDGSGYRRPEYELALTQREDFGEQEPVCACSPHIY